MKEDFLSQIETSEPVVTEPDTAAIPDVPVKEVPFLRRLMAKAFGLAAQQVTVVLFDQGFCCIANFLTGVLVARACSKEEYGYYVLGFTLLTVAMNIQTSLAGTPFTVFSPRLRDKEHRLYLGSTLVQHLAVSAFAVLGFLAAAAVLFAARRTGNFAGVLFALAAASVFVLLRDFMRHVLLAQLRVWASLLMGLVANVATVGILLLAYRGGWLTAPLAYLILGASSSLPVLFVLLSETKWITFASNKLWEHVKENWRFGKWLIAQVIVVFVAIQMYPWVLMLFKGSAAAGTYGVCIGLAAIANPLFMGLNSFLGPRTAHAARKGSAQIHREVYLAMTFLAGPLLIILLCTILFGEWAIVTIYGREFAGLGHIFSIVMLAVVIAAMGGITDAGINALRRPDIAFRARLLALAVTVTLGIFLVYKLGPLGAALGVCVARAFSVGYQLMKFQSLKNIGFQN